MNTRHWKLIQALALAALLPLFAACSSEGDELLQGLVACKRRSFC